MFNIKFSSITIESEDKLRAIIITPSSYKGQSDFRVMHYECATEHAQFVLVNNVKYYHDTVDQAIQYHDYFLSPKTETKTI